VSTPTNAARRVVYTALFGSYEALVEQPIARSVPGIDFICFSDVPRDSVSWRVVVVDLPVRSDDVRSARSIKILGHEALREYDEWLWIDNRVVLRTSPESVLDSWLTGFDLAIPLHDHRSSVADEYQAVLRAGFDSPYRVREELAVLRRDLPSVLAERPLWTGVIARRPSASVDDWAATWMAMVLLYSRRDQLSVNYAIATSRLTMNAVLVDNRSSPFHTWLSVEDLPKDATARFSASSGFRYRIRDYMVDRIILSAAGRLLRRVRRALLRLTPRTTSKKEPFRPGSLG
jgi:hypothetical protein